MEKRNSLPQCFDATRDFEEDFEAQLCWKNSKTLFPTSGSTSGNNTTSHQQHCLGKKKKKKKFLFVSLFFCDKFIVL